MTMASVARPARKRTQNAPLVPLEVGQGVEARYQGQPHGWHPGVVQHINEDGTLAIDYDDGTKGNRVKREHVRPPKTAPPPPPPPLEPTMSGRQSIKPDWHVPDPGRQYKKSPADSSMLGTPKYGKRGSLTVETLESAPKRTPQDRGSPSCVQDLSGKMCLAGGALPQLSFEEEQEEVEVELVDSRIRVWWTEEKAWYAGRVISAGRGVGGILHTVAYDDNTTQTHYLQSAESSLNERWQFEPSLECKTPAKAAALKLLLSAVSEPSVVVGWCDEWFLEAGLEVIEDSDGGAEEAEELVIHLGNTAGGVAANTCLAWPPPQPSSEQEEERVRRPALSGAEHDSDSMPSPRSASSSSSSSESDEAEVWYDEAVLEEEHDSDPMPSMHSASSPSTSASTSTGASGSGESNDAASDDAAEAEAEAEADEAVAEAEEAEVVSGWGSESEEDEAEDE